VTDKLRAEFQGPILLPGHADYDRARSAFNGAIDHHPTVIARCTSAADVSAALAYAQRSGLEVGVRSGGHSPWGACVPDRGLMLDLSLLNQVTVDPAARRARCAGGATMANLDEVTQADGLAVTGGTISHTGVGGLTLGGGLGWLLRRHGLAIDNLESAEVVLADGRCVRTCADEYPDLFWALRGGGGNFGVVTEFEYRLHPVGPVVPLTLRFWALDRCAAALRAIRDTVAALDPTTGAMIVAMHAPPAPFIPERHRSTPGIALVLVGRGADAAVALPPAFEVAMDLPYAQLQQMLDPSAPWGVHVYSKSLYLDELSDDVIAVVDEWLPRKTSPMTMLPIFPLGGAYASVPDDATAFGGPRSARYAFGMDAVATDAASLAADREWVRSMWQALLPFAAGSGGYVNFMAEDDEQRVRASYGPAKYDRLARLKTEYDPGNIFHRNANIRPRTAGLAT
jgi:FAD/FMN-containing dehydrogenase